MVAELNRSYEQLTAKWHRFDLADVEADTKALLGAYLRSLARECGRLPLGVVDPRFLQTSAEAPPPKPLNSATISGIAVISTFCAATRPISEPTTMPATM